MSNRFHRLALLVLLSAAALPSAPVFAQQNIDKVNGGITARAGQHYGDLTTVNGNIRIESGVHAGDAETVNGAITVGDDVTVGALSTVNGEIRAGVGLRADGAIDTVNGDVFIDRNGQLNRVSTVNGAIGLVHAGLAGGVETVNGNITVGAGSHLRGGITVRKPSTGWLSLNFGKRKPPRIVIGAHAVVEGPLAFEREVRLHVHRSARIGAVSGATPLRFDGQRAPAD